MTGLARINLALRPARLIRQTVCLASTATNNKQDSRGRLIYEGLLTQRILYLKCLSVSSSILLGGCYYHLIATKGYSIAIASVGLAFGPFFVSPFAVSWFFRRYVTKLYHDELSDTYTAEHYGWLLSKREHQFKPQDVKIADSISIINTFKAKGKPFFLNDEDLIDASSVSAYKHMLNLDKGSLKSKQTSDTR